MSFNSIPALDYIKNALYLQLTGALEQKMKCILWELASNDFDFRYNFLRDSHGEYSCYKDKNSVLSNIVSQIRLYCPNTNIDNLVNRQNLKSDIDNCIINTLLNSAFANFSHRDINSLIDAISLINDKQIFYRTSPNKYIWDVFVKADNCGDSVKLFTLYESAYLFRNRCAHNTKAYQISTPLFNNIYEQASIYNNIFMLYYVIVLMDALFIKLFEFYRETLLSVHRV